MSRNEIRSSEEPGLCDTYYQDNGLRGPTVDNGWKSCLHVRFSEQAHKHPDSIAIISETTKYTYKDVEDFSNAVARRIVQQTSGQNAFVGICMERSAQLIVGLIGILKAGCSYVPLDPTYPEDRINDMLLDIQAPVVVTTSGFKHIFHDHDLLTLCVEDTVNSRNDRPPLLKNVGPESLAYVIFTSGSTGKPKGVCCYHGSVLNLLSDFQDRQPIGHGDICSWWTSLNFDVSVYEIFSPLTEGSTLIVVPDSVRPDGPDLMEWLYNNNVTSAYLPPFMVSDLEIWTRKNPDKSQLRRLLVGVEPIPEKTLLAIDNAVPSIHIINGYGPTETTICATLYSINQANTIHENTPIGKPVQNTILRILDEDGNVVRPGETGELFIGGVGLALEYLNRPDLTQARFVTDHLSQDPQARLYKTGDLVRLLDDGNLEFLGRRDFQVKIRGFRVELGEIETLIRRLQPIREAVVILREDEPGRQILVAYFVCREGQSLPIRSIRDHLKKYLPDYMIPSAFIPIDTIPSTPNGKTDRAALPIPRAEHVIHSSDDEDQKPANQIESSLLGFFQDLLKIESVGVSDNFFELGGHSLLAAQLVSRIRDEFGIAICLQDIFQAPTIRRLSKTVHSLASTRVESSSIPLKCSPQLTEYPISYSQMRIWYLDQLEPNTPAYNICLCYKLLGPLDVKALNESVNLIAQRHQSLRTTFEKREPHPVQIVNRLEKFSIELLDISGVPLSEKASEARALYNKEIHRGFDLSKGPLFRFILIKLDREEHILVFTIHHIISDGWSMGIIVKDLMSLYYAIVSEKPISLPSQPFEYRDYALAQTEWMETDACHAQLSYWKQKFKTIPDPLELPTDFPRPAIQSYRGSSQTIVLDADLVKQLKRVGAKENTTLFMVLLAGLKTLLHRYTSQPDLCIGTFVANRNRQEIENIVGFFVNTVAIRTEIHDDPTIADLIVRVRDNALGAFANQDPPFERLLEEIKPERSLSRTPIFQVMMVLQNIPLPALELPNLRCAPIELETFRSNFDMTLWMYEIGDQLKIVFEYSIDLFKESTISRMLEHFRNLLKQACLNPQFRLSELEILSEQERKTLLADWSGNIPLLDTSEKTVVDIFEDITGIFDSKTAALDLHGDSGVPVELSYSDLNRKSNQLARGLKSRGVGPETCVAILLEPFRFMIIGILGILKSQAAYVPLDSKYPQKRIEFILNDTKAPFVITDQANEKTVQGLIENSTLSNRPEIICLDRDWDDFRQFSSDNVIEKPTRSNAAYVIYTSGSTGIPKGVIIEHEALSAFVKSAVKLYGISAPDRIQQFASPSFDASVEEIFCALCSGATLVLKSQTELQSISALAGEWSDSRITILDLPTAFWHQLTTALEEKSILLPETLRTVIIGGEQPSVERLNAWLRTASNNISLINTYGPTEATVVATAVDLSNWDSHDSVSRHIPIGRPLEHVKAYVLDKNWKPTPIGVPGELCIGGQALARGYVNLPDKTSERFIKDPFSNSSEDRIYRTGDRVRYLENGELEFCGRVDRQVKVRGFRVELDEIDSAMRSFPEISEAFTLDIRKDSLPVQLTTYIVLHEGSHIDESRLREELKNKLPDFMIPGAFTILDKFPLTSGGKIDVNALKEIRTFQTLGLESIVPPRTPVEEVLVNIWKDVFGTQHIGVNDNFFHLGGHSLLSIQIIDRVNKAGLRLTPAEFIQNPTIQEQAKVITTAKPSSEAGSWKCLVELQPRGSRPPLYLIHSNPGDVLGYVNLVNRLGADQPCFGFESLGLKAPSKAHKTVEEMAKYYIEEMISFQPEPPYYLAGWCYGGIVASEMAYQMQEMGKQVGMLVLIETPFPRMANVRASYYFKKLLGLAKLGPKGWISYIQNKFKYLKKIKSGAIDSAFSLEFDSGVLSNRPEVYRLNTQAMTHYYLKGFLSCPIRIFVGDVLEEGFIPDIENLWSKMSQDVQRYVAPGSHLNILKEPGANILAKQMRICLDEAYKVESNL